MEYGGVRIWVRHYNTILCASRLFDVSVRVGCTNFYVESPLAMRSNNINVTVVSHIRVQPVVRISLIYQSLCLRSDESLLDWLESSNSND
jgi:hypothetical protein